MTKQLTTDEREVLTLMARGAEMLTSGYVKFGTAKANVIVGSNAVPVDTRIWLSLLDAGYISNNLKYSGACIVRRITAKGRKALA